MKKSLRTLSIVMVLALALGATAMVGGCSKKETVKAPVKETPVVEPETTETTDPAKADVAAGEAVVQEMCITCHDASRIYLQPDGTDWARVIASMREQHGAVLTDEQQAQAVAFLEARTRPEGEQTIIGKCTSCHDTANIYNISGATSTNWESIMDRMMTAHGAKLTEAEQKAVLGYLENL